MTGHLKWRIYPELLFRTRRSISSIISNDLLALTFASLIASSVNAKSVHSLAPWSFADFV